PRGRGSAGRSPPSTWSGCARSALRSSPCARNRRAAAPPTCAANPSRAAARARGAQPRTWRRRRRARPSDAASPAARAGDRLGDRGHAGADALLARGVAESHVARRAEGAARHACDARLLEEEERDVLVVRDRLAIVLEPVQATAVRERVERALGLAA